MKNERKIKNIVYTILLITFLAVVALRTFQNISVIEQLSGSEKSGIEDISIIRALSGGEGGEGGGSCSCTAWSNAGCAVSPCVTTQMLQTRSCSGTACSGVATSQCICYGSCGCIIPTNAAGFLSQRTPPTNVYTTQPVPVWINMNNTGTATTWNTTNGYRLGSKTPENNTNWGLSRVDLSTSDEITVNHNKNFSFTVTAPTTPGVYDFQWRMLEENTSLNGWFGDYTPDVQINVLQSMGCTGHLPNWICEVGENQSMCPSDCNTTVSMTPNTNLNIGTAANITLNFSDSRYIAGHNVSLNLVIEPEGISWNSQDQCQYGGVMLVPGTGGQTVDGLQTVQFPAGTLSSNIHFGTFFSCYLPAGLGPGIHSLYIYPTIYSSPTNLSPVVVQFTISGNQASKNPIDYFSSVLNSFIREIKSFLAVK